MTSIEKWANIIFVALRDRGAVWDTWTHGPETFQEDCRTIIADCLKRFVADNQKALEFKLKVSDSLDAGQGVAVADKPSPTHLYMIDCEVFYPLRRDETFTVKPNGGKTDAT